MSAKHHEHDRSTHLANSQRAHQRFSVQMEAKIFSDDRLHVALTRDLSRGGICFTLLEPLQVGSPFTVELALIFSENTFSEPLVLSGKVIWCTKVDQGYQIGAVFFTLDETAQDYLNMFLSFLLRGHVPSKADGSGFVTDDDDKAEEEMGHEERDLFR